MNLSFRVSYCVVLEVAQKDQDGALYYLCCCSQPLRLCKYFLACCHDNPKLGGNTRSLTILLSANTTVCDAAIWRAAVSWPPYDTKNTLLRHRPYVQLWKEVRTVCHYQVCEFL